MCFLHFSSDGWWFQSWSWRIFWWYTTMPRINPLLWVKRCVMVTWLFADRAEFSIKNNALAYVVFEVSLGCHVPFSCCRCSKHTACLEIFHFLCTCHNSCHRHFSQSFSYLPDKDSRNMALNFGFRDFVLSWYPQQGHHKPSHVIKISQIWHRFWPFAYLREPDPSF